MPEDRPFTISSTGRLAPEELGRRTFPTVRRGFDPAHVRALLEEVARELQAAAEREKDLRRALADAEHRAANPVLDEGTLAAALGQETSRVLRSAHDAAHEVLTKAEADATRLVTEAQEEAEQIQQRVETIAAERSTQAEVAAVETRRRAQEEANSVIEMARLESEASLGETRSECREMVREAQELRNRVLTDLSRRRRVLHAQIEQLRAGRERLAETVRDVRRNIDRIADDLFRAEDEARIAAEMAGRQAIADASAAQPDAADIEALVEQGGGGFEEEPFDAGTEIGFVEPASAFRLVPRPPAVGPEEEASASAGHPAALARPAVAAPALRPVPEAPAEPAAEPAVTAATAGDEAVEGAERRPVVEVEELFARIRASRDAGSEDTAVVAAVVVETSGEVAEATPAKEVAGEHAAAADAGPQGEQATGERGAEEAPVDADTALLRRRNEVLRPAVTDLARRLKRTLQDDQNDLLDRLRGRGGTWSDELLPPVEEHEERFASVTVPHLQEAGRAGRVFAGVAAEGVPDVQTAAAELAASVVVPLRRRLADASGQLAGADEATVIEHIGAAYREWRGQRSERLAGDYAITAFSQAAAAALPKGSPMRWIVDDGGAPCPDCDDNALAGPHPLGEKFPTGHLHPPAHPGCRCLLAAEGASD